MTDKRILIIEDNRDNMTLIVDVLQSLDYGVLEASDGEQGMTLAKDEIPDLILLDLSLPRMDGWTVARQLKAEASIQHIPIIALTAHAMVGDRERAIEAGCNDYIAKPIDLHVLAAKLRQYLD
ncbi:MAG: response regulator [Aggregatilineales bacterium]